VHAHIKSAVHSARFAAPGKVEPDLSESQSNC
jgi:hypothetical protein